MAIATDLNNIKALEQGLTENKVSRFAYTQNAYDNDSVAGVPDYNPDRAMNVPQGTASVMQVNQTVIDKGWRAQASSLTRMLMNHFLGRISYNLNKAHDNLLSLVSSLQGSLGTANGIATLNSNGLLDSAQYPVKVNNISPDASAQITLRADDIDTHSIEAPDITDLGKTWMHGNNTRDNFLTVYHADGIWVAGSSSNTGGLWWSFDGKTWTRSNETYGYYFRSVYFADGIWVAGCDSSTGLWWSNDGKTWTQSNRTNASFISVYYANGIWVTGSNSNAGLWWSSDGKTWTQSNKTNDNFHAVYYADGIWVAGSGSDTGLWWSNDGKTWTQSNKTDNNFLTVYYADGIWVAGSYLNTGLWWSSDGKTWTQSNKTNDRFRTVYYADGIWVTGSFSGTGLWWSNDGKTWTQSNKTNGNFYSVYYADGIWVAGSDSGKGLWWSYDGKTWTQGNIITSNVFITVYYADGIWVAGSSNMGLWYSEASGTTKDVEKILRYLLSKVG